METFLSSLPATTAKGKRRVGRGYGSTLGGHTAGRGQKGQKARTKIHPAFMGTKVKKSLLQRLPVMRGKAKFKSLAEKTLVVNMDMLEKLEKNATVTIDSLVSSGFINASIRPSLRVKVVSDGTLSKPLTVAVPVSKRAQEKIEAAGGKVVSVHE